MSGLRLTVVGCSGSLPGPDGPASCYLLRAAHEGREWTLVLDLGSGALGALQRHTDPMTLDGIVLSHLHSDHCLDLTGLHVMRRHHPAGAAARRLLVHAPRGAAERLARAYGVDAPQDVTDVYDVRELGSGQPFTVGPFRVTPLRVEHPVEAYGLRVEAAGSTLAYTGDTDSCPALGPLMAGADLVLVDSAYVEGRDTGRGMHLTARRAAEAAVAAGGVQRLMLTHLPPWNDPEVCRAEAAGTWPGRVEVAEPGRSYEV